jgi:hypothetical protein
MKFMKSASIIIATLSIAPQLSLADGSFSASAGNLMSFRNAKGYCKDKGHLPTVREMANYAMVHGASGIKETSLAERPVADPSVKAEIITMAANGFKMIQKAGLWMPQVDFYYSSKGFQDASGGTSFWTSSTNSSSSSLAGGMISLVRGDEQLFTLSTLNGTFGEDTADSGRNDVFCATETINAPAPVTGSDSTIVMINPAQINFSAKGKTLYATILDSDSNIVENIALDTSNLGRDAASIQNASETCMKIASQAANDNMNLRLDLSYTKLEQFCQESKEVTYPVSLNNAN